MLLMGEAPTLSPSGIVHARDAVDALRRSVEGDVDESTWPLSIEQLCKIAEIAALAAIVTVHQTSVRAPDVSLLAGQLRHSAHELGK